MNPGSSRFNSSRLNLRTGAIMFEGFPPDAIKFFRQLAKNNVNVVLMRDLTDSMYNPKSWPHVSHVEGTALIISHIERHVCPTMTSDQILGGRPFEFRKID